MSEETTIPVNFGKPFPLFPLDSVTLLPQQLLPLHVFEPRYIQLVEHSLDGSGQFAMAVLRDRLSPKTLRGRPALRPAVCLGQIVQHARLDDGRYNVLLRGVCRARIIRELPPAEGRLYRVAQLEPVGVSGEEAMGLDDVRDEIEQVLSEGPLTQMTAANPLLDFIRKPEIPTEAILELISFTLVSDPEKRYRLLAEGDASERASLIQRELSDLGSLLKRAAAQHPEEWPKGCSWN